VVCHPPAGPVLAAPGLRLDVRSSLRPLRGGDLGRLGCAPALLGADLGTSWLLVGAAAACAVPAFLIARARGRLLTFGVLAGLPELSPGRYPGRLLTEGIYARIRHPRYVEVAVGTLAYALFANHVGTYVLWLLLLPTLLLVVRLEERELRERFGAAWDEYARRVPRFLPRRRRDGAGWRR
jgi:protein-S-isoprenylcysteine O-methyltransferase Ste14